MESVDVVVVGAGIAGISAAWHVQRRCPDLTFVVLEARADVGGTWSIHNYPGVRCDSDMYTLSFRFYPWTQPRAIADGCTILDYLRDAAASSGVGSHVRCRHRVVRAAWSSRARRWTLRVRTDSESLEFECKFLFLGTGYYQYDNGYSPDFPGMDTFSGSIVHPQSWPDEFDVGGKRVAVIGSGATAITLSPVLAETAGHVVMIQRSPSYVISRPESDRVANLLLRVLPRRVAVPMIRIKNIVGMTAGLYLADKTPQYLRKALLGKVRRELPADYPLAPNFSPRYNPWENRLCLALEGDLFKRIADGKLSIVTGDIERIRSAAVELRSGDLVPADVIVTATGFNMRLFGGIELFRDGLHVDTRQCTAYKGMMLTDLPNFFFTVGYQAASYTLKADLVSEFASRVIRYMVKRQYAAVEPRLDDPTIRQTPFTEYRPGYIERVLERLPRQGSRPPWRLTLNYFLDLCLVRYGRLHDNGLAYTAQ